MDDNVDNKKYEKLTSWVRGKTDAPLRVANGVPFSPFAELSQPGADGQVVELERGVGDEERQREGAEAEPDVLT